MKPKRVNPYDALKKHCHDVLFKIVHCRRRTMLEFPVGVLRSFSLLDVQLRVIAADQLGYEVVVFNHGEKLVFEYRDKRPEQIPYSFQL